MPVNVHIYQFLKFFLLTCTGGSIIYLLNVGHSYTNFILILYQLQLLVQYKIQKQISQSTRVVTWSMILRQYLEDML